MIDAWHLKMDIKYIGRLARADCIKEILLPDDRYLAFQDANLCSTLSTTGFQRALEALPTHRGSLRCEVRREITLHPIMFTSPFRSCSSMEIPTMALLKRLTLRR